MVWVSMSVRFCLKYPKVRKSYIIVNSFIICFSSKTIKMSAFLLVEARLFFETGAFGFPLEIRAAPLSEAN